MIVSLYGGCIPLDVLLLLQQLTNLAAVFAHCCTSPSRYGSFLSLVIFPKSFWVLVICVCVSVHGAELTCVSVHGAELLQPISLNPAGQGAKYEGQLMSSINALEELHTSGSLLKLLSD